MTLTPIRAAASPRPDSAVTPARGARLAGLDGLRAIAVCAVVVFHLDPNLLPGGFLGVDTFFVLSGFLITRMLLSEFTTTGAIALGRFYRRRAQRLLPAVAVLIAAVVTATLTLWPDEGPTLVGSVASSVGYVTNWWLIFDHQSYFVSTGRPPMLQHLWSLAIEEQYYVLWSAAVLTLTVVLGRRRRAGVTRRLRWVAWSALALALASTGVMGLMAVVTRVPYVSDSSRVYFGTDTHSMGLFLGSALGALAVISARTARSGPAGPRAAPVIPVWLSDVFAVAGLLALAWSFANVDEYAPRLYRGGFLVFDLLVAAVIWCLVRPGSAAGRLLDTGWLTWIGRRSYAIYLWHWPVVVLTRPGLDVHGPLILIDTARLGLVLVLSAASYRLVEQPLRYATWSGLRARISARITRARASAPARPRVTSRGWAAGGAVGLVSLAVLLVAAGGPSSAEPGPGPVARAVTTPTPTAHPTPTAAPGRADLSAFGDSVLLGAQATIVARDPHASIDAVEGQQAYTVLDLVAARARAGQLAPVVVIHTGNNGVIDPSQLAATLTLLHSRSRVVLVTDRVPRDWQTPNNHTIETVGARFANVTVLNWAALSAGHPGWFYADGLHLDPAGAAAYTSLLLAAARG